MKTITATLVFSCLLAVGAAAGADDPFAGRYEVNGVAGSALELTPTAPGKYEGALSAEGMQMQIRASRQGDLLQGQMVLDGIPFDFTARFEDGALVMVDASGARVVFSRIGGATPAAPAEPTGAIVINGKALTEQEIQGLRQAGVQPYPGRYWYDTKCGAWGMEGGPTVGFLASGIPAAPLDPQASGGNTGIFINGRQLPPQDLMALQALTGQLMPGRYFVDAMGNAGTEGGPILVNLVLLAQQTAAQGGGGNNWSSMITGASGNSSGDSGYVILKSPTGRPTTVGY